VGSLHCFEADTAVAELSKLGVLVHRQLVLGASA
jgi:hypothetical protein